MLKLKILKFTKIFWISTSKASKKCDYRELSEVHKKEGPTIEVELPLTGARKKKESKKSFEN